MNTENLVKYLSEQNAADLQDEWLQPLPCSSKPVDPVELQYPPSSGRSDKPVPPKQEQPAISRESALNRLKKYLKK